MFCIVPVTDIQLADTSALRHAKDAFNFPHPTPPLHRAADRERPSGPASRSEAGEWSPDFGKTTNMPHHFDSTTGLGQF